MKRIFYRASVADRGRNLFCRDLRTIRFRLIYMIVLGGGRFYFFILRGGCRGRDGFCVFYKARRWEVGRYVYFVYLIYSRVVLAVFLVFRIG